VALEAYPGFAVRRLFSGQGRLSYKNDAPSKQTPARADMRQRIVQTLVNEGLKGMRLHGEARLVDSLVQDGSGDRLDAVLCALQAAWGWQRRTSNFGLPESMDPVEGWIVSVPSA
jgi:predicted RNase H-like nuclease